MYNSGVQLKFKTPNFTTNINKKANVNVDILKIQAMKVQTLTTGVTMQTFPLEFTTLPAARGEILHSSMVMVMN